MTRGNVDMTRRRSAAVRFIIRPEREQEIAFERALIHADGGFTIVKVERGPVRARLQPQPICEIA